jgi:hypothetical protein
MFAFGLYTPAGLGAGPRLANATLDIWMSFSSTPITDLPRDDPGNNVPEPASAWLVFVAGLLAAAGRRRRD